MEKNMGKKEYICITESLCCTVEINTANQLYLNFFFLKNWQLWCWWLCTPCWQRGGGEPSVWQALPPAPAHLLRSLRLSCRRSGHSGHGRLPAGAPWVWNGGVPSPGHLELPNSVNANTVSYSRGAAMEYENFLLCLQLSFLFELALESLKAGFCICKAEITNSTSPTSPDSYFQNQKIWVKVIWTLQITLLITIVRKKMRTQPTMVSGGDHVGAKVTGQKWCLSAKPIWARLWQPGDFCHWGPGGWRGQNKGGRTIKNWKLLPSG